MPSIPTLLLLAVAIVGHVAIWTSFYNRLHASGVPSNLVHRLEKFIVLAMILSMVLPAVWFVQLGGTWFDPGRSPLSWIARLWIIVCCGMLFYVTAVLAVRRWRTTDGKLLLSNATQIIDTESALGFRPVGDRRTRWQSRIPGNQILEVHFQHKVIGLPNLPLELDGLLIAHLSDLHMTGQIRREFFDVAVDQMNAWNVDVVAITGDLIDKAACIEWIPNTIGRLTSRHGVFALLGNHDQRLQNVQHLRSTLADCGIIDLGGNAQVRRIRDQHVLLAGNECPWFPPAPTIPDFASTQRPFSILLSHSPDTIHWARRHQFDLMLAGHTHGGQIRVPLIGPIVCPSRYGVQFAAGVFDLDPVLMHVSRGISGVHTLRFNCPPEVTLLELRRKAGQGTKP